MYIVLAIYIDRYNVQSRERMNESMIYKDYFCMLTEEEQASYILKCCQNCPFYNTCELLNYITMQSKRDNVAQPVTILNPLHIEKGKVYPAFATLAKANRYSLNQDSAATEPPLYVKAFWENGNCPMRMFNLVECGNQWVSNGIGDDYKIDIKYDYSTGQSKIERSSRKRHFDTCKWEPRQPVFISAPTGGGKNTFVERDLPEYIRGLNHRNRTNHKILIFSNRRALTEQTRDRVNKGATENEDIYYDYKEYVDLMPYHSLLNKVEYLKRIQTHGKSKYLFVICDEAHFFTSDAVFNPDTEKILEAIVNIFQDAIRVYMTATPYECLEYIQKKESYREKYISGVLYHFQRDYRYLNTKYFSEEAELRDIIINSVVDNNEKWLVFIDNKRQCASFKRLLEYDNGEESALKGKLTIDADSKYNDKKYQEMMLNEKFVKNVNVIISTSVIDNGVNFRDIENVVITDLDRTKCLQMVGRVRVDKDHKTKAALSKVTLYIKRHDKSFLSKRLKSLGVQQDAYHAYDLAAESRNYKWGFLDKYYDNDSEDWENAKQWFGRNEEEPDRLYPNQIARSLADKYVQVYESILQEMAETDKGKKVTGQRYLEFQLSWFGKKYSKKHDITLSGCKNDRQLELEKWLLEECVGQKIPKEAQKNFGKKFFAKYNTIFGLCTKKQGFSSDDNRGKDGPRTAGYSFKRINEIFQVRKMPFKLIEDNGDFIIKTI